jgi:hypothetical protein
MITLETFFERLARGPLKNTAAVDDTNLGEIVPLYYDSVRMLINEGLREISTKKMVSVGRIKITWMGGQSDYVLKEENVGVYIENYNQTDELEFADDLFVRVNSVFTIADDGEDSARILLDSVQGISTPSFNRLRVTSTFRTLYEDGIRVYYQARHPALVDLEDEINLPPNLEYALQLFVASQYISQMNGPEHAKRGDEYRAKYLQEMGEDEAKNLSTTSQIDRDDRFTDRGFV